MSKSEYIHKSDNVSVMLYHFVFPTKYRRVVFDKSVDANLVSICDSISLHYEVHFLVQSVPSKSVTSLVKMIKSITAREFFKFHPEVKKILWGGSFWSSDYIVNTVSKFGDENSISKYVRDQGLEKEYSYFA